MAQFTKSLFQDVTDGMDAKAPTLGYELSYKALSLALVHVDEEETRKFFDVNLLRMVLLLRDQHKIGAQYTKFVENSFLFTMDIYLHSCHREPFKYMPIALAILDRTCTYFGGGRNFYQSSLYGFSNTDYGISMLPANQRVRVQVVQKFVDGGAVVLLTELMRDAVQKYSKEALAEGSAGAPAAANSGGDAGTAPTTITDEPIWLGASNFAIIVEALNDRFVSLPDVNVKISFLQALMSLLLAAFDEKTLRKESTEGIKRLMNAMYQAFPLQDTTPGSTAVSRETSASSAGEGEGGVPISRESSTGSVAAELASSSSSTAAAPDAGTVTGVPSDAALIKAFQMSFQYFWLENTLKLLCCQSIVVRLFGWEQLQEMLQVALNTRPHAAAYVICNAGAKVVNGVYDYAGMNAATADSSPKYEKKPRPKAPGDDPNEPPEPLLTLFRCNMQMTKSKWWFLSEADAEKPGCEHDVDYYNHRAVSVVDDDREPPAFGWILAHNSPGCEPMPIVRRVGMHIPASSAGPEDFFISKITAWVGENNIMRHIIDVSNVHREVINRASKLVLVMTEMQLITAADVKIMWNGALTTPASDCMEEIFGVLVRMSTVMDEEMFEDVLVQQCLTAELNTQLQNYMASLSGSAGTSGSGVAALTGNAGAGGLTREGGSASQSSLSSTVSLSSTSSTAAKQAAITAAAHAYNRVLLFLEKLMAENVLNQLSLRSVGALFQAVWLAFRFPIFENMKSRSVIQKLLSKCIDPHPPLGFHNTHQYHIKVRQPPHAHSQVSIRNYNQAREEYKEKRSLLLLTSLLECSAVLVRGAQETSSGRFAAVGFDTEVELSRTVHMLLFLFNEKHVPLDVMLVLHQQDELDGGASKGHSNDAKFATILLNEVFRFVQCNRRILSTPESSTSAGGGGGKEGGLVVSMTRSWYVNELSSRLTLVRAYYSICNQITIPRAFLSQLWTLLSSQHTEETSVLFLFLKRFAYSVASTAEKPQATAPKTTTTTTTTSVTAFAGSHVRFNEQEEEAMDEDESRGVSPADHEDDGGEREDAEQTSDAYFVYRSMMCSPDVDWSQSGREAFDCFKVYFEEFDQTSTSATSTHMGAGSGRAKESIGLQTLWRFLFQIGCEDTARQAMLLILQTYDEMATGPAGDELEDAEAPKSPSAFNPLELLLDKVFEQLTNLCSKYRTPGVPPAEQDRLCISRCVTVLHEALSNSPVADVSSEQSACLSRSHVTCGSMSRIKVYVHYKRVNGTFYTLENGQLCTNTTNSAHRIIKGSEGTVRLDLHPVHTLGFLKRLVGDAAKFRKYNRIVIEKGPETLVGDGSLLFDHGVKDECHLHATCVFIPQSTSSYSAGMGGLNYSRASQVVYGTPGLGSLDSFGMPASTYSSGSMNDQLEADLDALNSKYTNLEHVGEAIVSRRERFDVLLSLTNVLVAFSSQAGTESVSDVLTSLWFLLMRLPTQADMLGAILAAINIENNDQIFAAAPATKTADATGASSTTDTKPVSKALQEARAGVPARGLTELESVVAAKKNMLQQKKALVALLDDDDNNPSATQVDWRRVLLSGGAAGSAATGGSSVVVCTYMLQAVDYMLQPAKEMLTQKKPAPEPTRAVPIGTVTNADTAAAAAAAQRKSASYDGVSKLVARKQLSTLVQHRFVHSGGFDTLLRMFTNDAEVLGGDAVEIPPLLGKYHKVLQATVLHILHHLLFSNTSAVGDKHYLDGGRGGKAKAATGGDVDDSDSSSREADSDDEDEDACDDLVSSDDSGGDGETAESYEDLDGVTASTSSKAGLERVSSALSVSIRRLNEIISEKQHREFVYMLSRIQDHSDSKGGSSGASGEPVVTIVTRLLEVASSGAAYESLDIVQDALMTLSFLLDLSDVATQLTSSPLSAGLLGQIFRSKSKKIRMLASDFAIRLGKSSSSGSVIFNWLLQIVESLTNGDDHCVPELFTALKTLLMESAEASDEGPSTTSSVKDREVLATMISNRLAKLVGSPDAAATCNQEILQGYFQLLHSLITVDIQSVRRTPLGEGATLVRMLLNDFLFPLPEKVVPVTMQGEVVQLHGLALGTERKASPLCKTMEARNAAFCALLAFIKGGNKAVVRSSNASVLSAPQQQQLAAHEKDLERSLAVVLKHVRGISDDVVDSIRNEWGMQFTSEMKDSLQQPRKNSLAASKFGRGPAQNIQFTGLKNQGCTCYLNSLIQQLFMNLHFRETVLRTPVLECHRTSLWHRSDADLVGREMLLEQVPEAVVGAAAGGGNAAPSVWRRARVTNFSEEGQLHHVDYLEKDEATGKWVRAETALFNVKQGRPGRETGRAKLLPKMPCAPGEEQQFADIPAVTPQEEAAYFVLEHLQRSFVFMLHSQRRYVDPKPFVEACKSLNLTFSVFQQNDASEFCDQLLDRLETAMRGKHTGVDMWGGVMQRAVFGGKTKAQKIPKDCHAYSSVSKEKCGQWMGGREEGFINIELIIRGKEHIDESFSDMVRGELMDGDNKLNCDTCNEKKAVTRRQCLSSLPNMLILHLKRFDLDFTTFETIKLNNKIVFGTLLNVMSYTSEGLDALEGRSKKEAKGAAEGDTSQVSDSGSSVSAGSTSGAAASPGRGGSKHTSLVMETEGDADADAGAGAGAGIVATAGAAPPAPAVEADNEVEVELDPADFEYQLQGVLVHMGVAQGGHYYSFIRDSSADDAFRCVSIDEDAGSKLPGEGEATAPAGGKWFRFDDDEVTSFNPEYIPVQCFGGSYASSGGAGSAMSSKFSQEERCSNALMLFYTRTRTPRGSQSCKALIDKVIADAVAKRAEEAQKQPAQPVLTMISGYEAFTNEVWHGNQRDVRLSYMLDRDLHTFVRALMPIITGTSRAAPLAVSTVDFAAHLLFDVVLHSRERSGLHRWVTSLKTLITHCSGSVGKTDVGRTNGAFWFIRQLLEPDHAAPESPLYSASCGWMYDYLVLCSDAIARGTFVQVLAHCLDSLLHASLPNSDSGSGEATGEGEGSDQHMQRRLHDLLKYASFKRDALNRLAFQEEDANALIIKLLLSVGDCLVFVASNLKVAEDVLALIRDIAALHPVYARVLLELEFVPRLAFFIQPEVTIAAAAAPGATPTARRMGQLYRGVEFGTAKAKMELMMIFRDVYETIAAIVGVSQPKKVALLEDGDADAAKGKSGTGVSKWAEPDLSMPVCTALTTVFWESCSGLGMDIRDFMDHIDRTIYGNATGGARGAGGTGQRATYAQVRQLFDRYDTTSDGRLTLVGFLAYYRNMALVSPKAVWRDLHRFGYENDLTRPDCNVAMSAVQEANALSRRFAGQLGTSAGGPPDVTAVEDALSAMRLPDQALAILGDFTYYDIGLDACASASIATAKKVCLLDPTNAISVKLIRRSCQKIYGLVAEGEGDEEDRQQITAYFQFLHHIVTNIDPEAGRAQQPQTQSPSRRARSAGSSSLSCLEVRLEELFFGDFGVVSMCAREMLHPTNNKANRLKRGAVCGRYVEFLRELCDEYVFMDLYFSSKIDQLAHQQEAFEMIHREHQQQKRDKRRAAQDALEAQRAGDSDEDDSNESEDDDDDEEDEDMAGSILYLRTVRRIYTTVMRIREANSQAVEPAANNSNSSGGNGQQNNNSAPAHHREQLISDDEDDDDVNAPIRSVPSNDGLGGAGNIDMSALVSPPVEGEDGELTQSKLHRGSGGGPTLASFTIFVDGAGVEEVNGAYEFDRILDGVASFAKFGEAPNRVTGKNVSVRFVIYRCEMSIEGEGGAPNSTVHQWFISVPPGVKDPGTNLDHDYYSCATESAESGSSSGAHMFAQYMPPRTGWEVCSKDEAANNRGEDPAPQIVFISSLSTSATNSVVNTPQRGNSTVGRSHSNNAPLQFSPISSTFNPPPQPGSAPNVPPLPLFGTNGTNGGNGARHPPVTEENINRLVQQGQGPGRGTGTGPGRQGSGGHYYYLGDDAVDKQGPSNTVLGDGSTSTDSSVSSTDLETGDWSSRDKSRDLRLNQLPPSYNADATHIALMNAYDYDEDIPDDLDDGDDDSTRNFFDGSDDERAGELSPDPEPVWGQGQDHPLNSLRVNSGGVDSRLPRAPAPPSQPRPPQPPPPKD